MGNFKRLGCCTVCDVPIFEIVAEHMDGPLKGEIKQVGQPFLGVRRTYIVRVSGRTSFWSLCATCVVSPSDIFVLNRKEIASMVRERDMAVNDNPRQRDYRERMLKLFQFDVPLGLLGEIPWSEVK